MRTRTGLGLAIGLLLGSALAPGSVVTAAQAASASTPAAPTFTVNTLGDAPASAPLANGVCETAPGNHTCTLRAAIMKANHNPGGGVTIHLPAGEYDLSGPSGGDDESSGDLNITNSLTLNGDGAGVTFIDAQHLDRVMDVGPGITVTISNVTLRNGLIADFGGGLQNYARLTLNQVVISGNRAFGSTEGGGVVNQAGVLTLNQSSVTGNAADGNGAGIANEPDSALILNDSLISGNHTLQGGYGGGVVNDGPLTLNNSLVSDNQTSPQNGNPHAGYGGGLANFGGGVVTATNSTLSNNSAYGVGGGIYNIGTVNAVFITIAGNLADSYATGAFQGGGIYNGNPGTANLRASLLGQNYQADTANDGVGNFASPTYDLIQTTTGMTLTGAPGHNVTGVDPLLDSARPNGGPTPTRALLAGSPALDAIPTDHCLDLLAAPLTTDQRGSPRPAGGACDIGAYEGQQPLGGYLRNLVLNGDAEGAAGSPDPDGAFVGVPEWHNGGQLLTVVPYNTPGGFPTVPTDTVPALHGSNFFAGGPSSSARGMQNIDLSALAAGIDAGSVHYDFSADLGGFAADGDNAKAEVGFYDGLHNPLGQSILGPVTDADRGCPINCQTGLLHRAATGVVPLQTRSVVIYLTMTLANGGYDDGYADNIALVLYKARLFLPMLR